MVDFTQSLCSCSMVLKASFESLSEKVFSRESKMNPTDARLDYCCCSSHYKGQGCFSKTIVKNKKKLGCLPYFYASLAPAKNVCGVSLIPLSVCASICPIQPLYSSGIIPQKHLQFKVKHLIYIVIYVRSFHRIPLTVKLGFCMNVDLCVYLSYN